MEFTKEEILGFKKFLNLLSNFKRDIENTDYIHNKKDFFDIIKKFRKFLLENENTKNYEILKHSKEFEYYKNYFTEINQYYLRSLETIQTLSIMTKGIHNFDSFGDLLDKELIKESFERKEKELKPLNFDNVKKIVLVGSGPLPETLLYVYENSNIEEITGIDYNHEAVFMAGEMINGLNLSKINIQQYDGTLYNYSDVDIVILPIFVSPKYEIIEQVLKTGKDTIQILLTNPKGFGNLLYEGLESIPSQAKIVYRKDFYSSFLAQEIIKLEKYNF